MAEQTANKRRPSTRQHAPKLRARDAAARAREELPELLGQDVESILGLERNDGGFIVTVSVVELARVPRSTDVLGVYRVALDEDGELNSYERVRRYVRSQADQD